MKMNLLYKSIALAGVASVLAACGGPGEGYDAGLKADSEITFASADLTKTYNEADAGSDNKIRINLLEGGTVDGQSLEEFDGLINIINFNFEGLDPENGGVEIPRVERRTPFSIVGHDLVIDMSYGETGMGHVLRENCNDVENPEYPDTATFVISYTVDNGYPANSETDPETGSPIITYPGDRTLTLTLNAMDDVTTGIDGPEDFSLQKGASKQLGATRVQSYACDAPLLEYSSADETIATVDAEGVVTGVEGGTTTITVTHPATGISEDFDVTVSVEFALTLTNADATKTVPQCTNAGVYVEPTAAAGSTLSGEYTYDWTVTPTNTNGSMSLLGAVSDGGYGSLAIINAATIADTASVTVGLAEGDTGTTDIDAVMDASTNLSVGSNFACVSANPDGGNISMDNRFESIAFWNPIVGTANGVDQATGDDAFGSSMRFTTATDDSVVGAVLVRWAKGPSSDNPFSAYYGVNNSGHGTKLKAGLWVKLDTAKAGVTAHFNLAPWLDSRHPAGEGKGYLVMNQYGPDFTAELANTTEWQFVEFTDRNWTEDTSDDSEIYTIPTTWANDGANWSEVLPLIYVRGLAAGESVLVDDLSVVEQ